LADLDGPELVKKLGDAVAGSAVVFMSGNVKNIEDKYFGLSQTARFIEKPFTPLELETMVSQTLYAEAATG